MTTYHLDLTRQQVRATGVVNESAVWLQDAETKKWKSTNTQAVNEQGVPLWDVEVQFIGVSFGKMQTQLATVQVPSPTQPTLPMGELAPLANVQVAVQVKNGKLSERWTAESISAPTSSRSSRQEQAA